MTDAPAPTPTPEPTPTPTPAPTPWYHGQDSETVGYVQSRGWDKLAEKDAAVAAAKAHREAQQYITKLTGTSDRERFLLRPAPDAPQAEQDAFWQKLGRGAKAEDYDLGGVKLTDGTDLDASYVDHARAMAFKYNIPVDRAKDFLKDLIVPLEKAEAASAADEAARQQSEMADLKRNWGANYEANNFIATQGAAKLGLTQDMLKAMAKERGPKAVMETMLSIGQKFGEDRFIASRAPGGTGVMTKDQAKARFAELKADRDFGRKLFRGDAEATREWESLQRMMVGQPEATF